MGDTGKATSKTKAKALLLIMQTTRDRIAAVFDTYLGKDTTTPSHPFGAHSHGRREAIFNKHKGGIERITGGCRLMKTHNNKGTKKAIFHKHKGGIELINKER